MWREKLKLILTDGMVEIAGIGVTLGLFFLRAWIKRRVAKDLAKELGVVTQTTKENEMQAIQTVAVELKVPKESKEVADAVTMLVADIRAKKPLGEIAGGALPKIITAVDGFEMLDDEVKSEHKHDLVAYLSREITKALGV